MTDKSNEINWLPPRDSNPDKLIQSQQVTLTGTEMAIENVLKTIAFAARYQFVTVTLTPTSVTDATVGVTQDSQQNPRQEVRRNG